MYNDFILHFAKSTSAKEAAMKHSLFLKISISLCLAALLCILIVGGINVYMLASVADSIVPSGDAATLENVDCVIVLGCLVKKDGRPSDMLEDRLRTGISLYELGVSDKLLMSGDHGQKEYNEVGTMKDFAITAGIPSENVFMDHAGFSTYESIYRAKEIFGAKKIVIVTQKYHLTRALYIAKALGIEAYGVCADVRTYSGQIVRDLREMLARVKDFAYTVAKPLPTYLGEPVDIHGSGDVTND